MGTFVIEVQEILSRKISVEAENLDGAISKVKEDYRKEKIVLDADDFIEVDFSLIQIIHKLMTCLIATEVGSAQCIVNEEYLFELRVKYYFIREAIKQYVL